MLRYKNHKLSDGTDRLISTYQVALILGVSVQSVRGYANADKKRKTTNRRRGTRDPQLTLCPVKQESKKAGSFYSLRMTLEFAIARDAMYSDRAHLTKVRAEANRKRKNIGKGINEYATR